MATTADHSTMLMSVRLVVEAKHCKWLMCYLCIQDKLTGYDAICRRLCQEAMLQVVAVHALSKRAMLFAASANVLVLPFTAATS